MLAAFSIEELLKAFGWLTLVLAGLIILVKWFAGVALGKQIPVRNGVFSFVIAVGGLISQAVGIAGLALWLLDLSQVWRPAWGVLGLDRWVFPDLNGKWKGTLLSNGPQHGYKDFCPKAESGNGPASCASPDPTKFSCLPVEVTVSMTLVTTDLELVLCNFHSHSTSVSLRRRAGTYDAKLTYLFEVPAQPPTSLDPAAFVGSAILEVDSNNNRSMQGYYWTDRYWRDGRQTGGYITLTRQ